MKKNIKKTLALVFTAAVLFSSSGCLKYTSNILEVTNSGSFLQTTAPHTTQAPQNTTGPDLSNEPTTSSGISPESTSAPEVTAAPQNPVTPSGNVTPSTTIADNSANPASWSKQEIITFATNAINKTKAFTGNVTVNHTESFEANVTKAPGGATIQNIANRIISSVVKPTDEIMNFAGGKAVNSEGETVPLLLPKRNDFSLAASGVASASAQKTGDNTLITIQLVAETGTLTNHPQYHAGSLGYLDASDIDLTPVTLEYLDIDYKGSTMTVTINENGYVISADYSIPIEVRCKGRALGMSAEVECVGEQAETWKINW